MRNERSHHADRGGRKKGGAENNVTHNGLCQISTEERARGDDTRDERASRQAHPVQPCRDR